MRSRLNRIWNGIKARCYNPKYHAYPGYGGRGITMCDEWKNSSKAFADWAMTHGYADNLSVDRIDNDKGYCPENCRWVTHKEQTHNFRKNLWITIDERTQILSDWCREAGISTSLALHRLGRGMSPKETFSSKPYHGKAVEGIAKDGTRMVFSSIMDASRAIGRCPAAIIQSINRNQRCASIKWRRI